jgi:hypothetical protein
MGSWHVSVLPKAEYAGNTYCYFGVNESQELLCIGGKKKRHQKKHECAVRSFAKKTFEVFKSQEKLEKKIQEKHLVSRIKDKRSKNVTYILKMSLSKDPIEAFRRKVDVATPQPFYKIADLLAIKVDTLCHLVKTHQHIYEGRLFHHHTWTVLEKAVEKKYI